MRFSRKNIRLPASNYLGERWYFITCCTEGRLPRFGDPALGSWIVSRLRSVATAHNFNIYAYCVMPDHTHFLPYGLSAESNLLAFVERFKQATGYEFEASRKQRLWQKKFYDHIIRKLTSIDAVAGYIWMNPVRKGLCKRAEAYPLSGSFMVPWPPKSLPDDAWLPPWKQHL